MYKSSSMSSISDIASLFSEDFYNSACVYQLSKTQSGDYLTNYRTREDLISKEAYESPNFLGLVLLGYGSTQEVNGRTVDPLTYINMIYLEDFIRNSSGDIHANSIVPSKDRSTVAPEYTIKEYTYENGRFTRSNNE